MKVLLVVGARPNFMKAASIIRAFEKREFRDYIFVHTGQHHDWEMFGTFFKDLELPKPDVNLEMRTNTHASLGLMMSHLDDFISRKQPDVVVVVGDVDSTLAAALVVAKGNRAKLAHVEAGLRSFDRSMPEEINRILVDVISDYCFAITKRDVSHLYHEGISKERIFHVGDTMADSLLYYLPEIKLHKLENDKCIFVTLHRPSNVDLKEKLENILQTLLILNKEISIVFPIHPRTLKRIEQFGFRSYLKLIKTIPPLSYLETIAVICNAALVLTDSGGIQTETSVLGIPCLTLRDNTEHYNTLEIEGGTNKLIELNKNVILNEVQRILQQKRSKYLPSHFEWDGKAAVRIVDVLLGDEN